MTELSFEIGELFCGPGGMALGAKHAARAINNDLRSSAVTLQHAWANDYDADTARTFFNNILVPEYGAAASYKESASEAPIGPGAIIHQNVRELEIDRLGFIDGLAFGFPCNDYSHAGTREGLDGRFGPLYAYGVEVLASHAPKWFVAENVSGIRGANNGRAFVQILQALKDPAKGLKYRLYPHLYSFDKYGVPQRRQRVVIVGIRDDLGVDFKVPSPTMYEHLDVSAGNALSGLRIDAANHDHSTLSKTVIERLENIRPGENAFNADLPSHLKLQVKALTNSQVYRRLEASKPSYTVTGAGGGGTYVYHWDEPRALTNRERARLQTFPDDFVFHGGRESVRKQVGMAVPVRGAQAIFTALFNSFLEIEYPSIPANLSKVIE